MDPDNLYQPEHKTRASSATPVLNFQSPQFSLRNAGGQQAAASLGWSEERARPAVRKRRDSSDRDHTRITQTPPRPPNRASAHTAAIPRGAKPHPAQPRPVQEPRSRNALPARPLLSADQSHGSMQSAGSAASERERVRWQIAPGNKNRVAPSLPHCGLQTLMKESY